jgi:hypothetical protein
MTFSWNYSSFLPLSRNFGTLKWTCSAPVQGPGVKKRPFLNKRQLFIID